MASFQNNINHKTTVDMKDKKLKSAVITVPFGVPKQLIDDIKFWNDVCQTDLDHTKDVEYGKRKYTTINAQYQTRLATEKWGLYGKSWGLKDISFYTVDKVTWKGDLDVREPLSLVLQATFYYPGGEFPVAGDIKFSEEDKYKKLLTDVKSKALSMLGFNADVFMGMFDDQKYRDTLNEDFQLELADKRYQLLNLLNDPNCPLSKEIIEETKKTYIKRDVQGLSNAIKYINEKMKEKPIEQMKKEIAAAKKPAAKRTAPAKPRTTKPKTNAK